MSAFEFLQIPDRPCKPRKTGMTAINDFGLSLREVEDILQTVEDVVDIAKYKDHGGEIYRYSREFLVSKNALYHKYGVRTKIGGAPFEIAYLQGKYEEYLNRLVDLDFDIAKISNYDMPVLSTTERVRLIKQAASKLSVAVVILRRDLGGPADPAWAIQEALQNIEAGASLVTLDQQEGRLWREHRPEALHEFASAVGLEHILFDVGVGVEASWFVRELGADVNLVNVNIKPPNGATNLEMLRRGLHRDVNYAFIREKGAKVT